MSNRTSLGCPIDVGEMFHVEENSFRTSGFTCPCLKCSMFRAKRDYREPTGGGGYKCQRDLDGIAVQEDDLKSRDSGLTEAGKKEIMKKLDVFEASLDKQAKSRTAK